MNRAAAAFSLHYHEATQRLLGTWTHAAGEDELRADYEQLLAQAQACQGCRFWQLDIRGRAWHSPEFGRWLAGAFGARLHLALGKPLFLAFVLGPTQAAHAAAPNAQALQIACSEHDVYPFFFGSVADASAWLEHQQALG